ncbi:DNA-processing protein DprA [Krasilnikoviella flava]|uniref:DNA protecting protein DprA n=1 Tax=Krasilnikoviella flava TaxID=526729 RepID=A0A1T5LS49_9MICO|nr:DNA-processing protein DprA [Krasilnikoviella flava]SKC78714.1 DNA protecting protein DprA [Krasilnikoviella flava]
MAEPVVDAVRARVVSALPFDTGDPVLARAAWSRLAEPADAVAGALVAHLGAQAALEWVVDAVGDPARALRGSALEPLGSEVAADRLMAAVARWAPRLDRLDPRRELRVLERFGGTLLVPGDPRWPTRLPQLGPEEPFALWVRGDPDLAGLTEQSVALVGARASSAYGDHVAADLAAGLADRGFTVVSGVAYGIDAAAHRGALAGGAPTVAVLAGGVDRFYPPGNEDLLRRLADGAGAVVSEVPPGSAPFKQRFLARNRVIAAVSCATVVVEAAWRSGALSTARHATRLLRPLGAVPGPVTSGTSTGCHVLLRDGAAVCVTDAAEVIELAGPYAGALEPDRAAHDEQPVAGRAARTAARRRTPAEVEALGERARRVWDALPVRAAAGLDALARTAGLAPGEMLAGLGALEMHGLAAQEGGRWRRVPREGTRPAGRRADAEGGEPDVVHAGAG